MILTSFLNVLHHLVYRTKMENSIKVQNNYTYIEEAFLNHKRLIRVSLQVGIQQLQDITNTF